MPLQLALQTDPSVKIATFRIAELQRTGGGLTPLLRETQDRDLVVSDGHRMLYLGLNTVAAGRDPTGSARDLGWRYFVKSTGRVVAAVEVRRTSDGGYRPGPLTEGPLVWGTVRAIQEAEVLTKHDPADYEPILLVAPALHVSVLLLRTGNSELNRILPVPPISRPFRPFHPISVRSFETDLIIIAKQVRDKTADLLAAEKHRRRLNRPDLAVSG